MSDPTRPLGDGADQPPGMPRWVKVSLIVVGALVLLFLVLKLAGLDGEHGPSRHALGGQAETAAATAPAEAPTPRVG